MAGNNIHVDLVNNNNISKLINWRLNPVLETEKVALSLLLGVDNTGLAIFNSDLNYIEYWNGSVFLPFLPNRITQTAVNLTLAYNTHRIVECIASNLQITLPTAVGKAGIDFVVKQSNFTNTTILTTSSQTIDDSLSITLNNPYESRTFVSNNLNWIIV